MDYEILEKIEAKAMQEVKEHYNTISERAIEILFENIYFITKSDVLESINYGYGVTDFFVADTLATLLIDYSILYSIKELDQQEQIDTIKRAYGVHARNQIFVTEEDCFILVD